VRFRYADSGSATGRRLLLVWLALSPAAFAKQRDPMSVDPREGARDPQQVALLANALTLARSRRDDEQGELLKLLESRAFLDKLDTEADVLNLGFPTQLERIIDALIANEAPPARHTLLELTASKTFLHDDRRTDALIRATAVLRPASAPLVRFWQKHSRPDDGFTNLTIPAAIANGSPAAIKFFEAVMLNRHHEPGDKEAWLYTDVLTHRTEAPLLAGCERLLASHLAPPLKSVLIDSLFDYRPDEWYGEEGVPPPPPPFDQASPEARETLSRIAAQVLTHMHPTKRQEAAIEAAGEHAGLRARRATGLSSPPESQPR
jgi:hypothetical protein